MMGGDVWIDKLPPVAWILLPHCKQIILTRAHPIGGVAFCPAVAEPYHTATIHEPPDHMILGIGLP